MGALAGLATQVLSAVTSQLGSYFDASKGALPPRQYIVPSTAFILACVGLAMVVLGPAVPGAMWNELPSDVKLLVTALLVIAFVVVTEASRNLAQLVRRLYSGTWPTNSWWQQMLRHKHLRRRLNRNTQAFDLERARVEFQEVRALIGVHQRADSMEDPPAAVAMEEYPVLRSTFPPFRLITQADLERATRPKQVGVVTSVVDLIGRYALTPVPAQQPVPIDSVRTPPDPRFLADGRTVVAVPVTGLQAAAYLRPGVVAAFQTPDGHFAPDLLILDRPTETQLVISLRDADLALVVAAARDGAGTFVVEPHAQESYFAVVPTARRELRAGQLVGRGDVEWEARGAPWRSAQPPLTEADVVGRVFWPANGPSKEIARLAAHEVLTPANLLVIPDSAWLSDAREPRRVCYASRGAAISAGDVVTIRRGACVLAEQCFVFEVQGNVCYVAVPKSTAALPDRLTVSAHGVIPVVASHIEPGRLIGEAQLRSLNSQRLAELPSGSCVLEAQVRHHYVSGDAWLAPNQPIPGGRLVPAFPSDAVDLNLPEEHLQGRHIQYLGPSLPAYGDLVTISIERDGKQVWAHPRLFVLCAEPGQQLIVKMPLPPADVDPRGHWLLPDTVARVRTTHSDELALESLDKLKKRIEHECALPHFNAAMSDNEPSTAEFCEHAPKLAKLGREIHKHRARLLQRPWSASCATPAVVMLAEYDRLLLQLDGAISMWLDLVNRVRDNIERAMLIDLPRDPSDVRPTALGNVLAASAAYPWRAYGIDTTTILPMLLTVLSGEEPAVQRFRAADASLDLLLLSSFWATVWSLLCVLTGFLAGVIVSGADRWVFPFMALAGMGFAWLMREAALAQAYGYGDAGKVLFDLHRHKLFASLGLVVKDDLTAQDESELYWQPLYRWFAFGEHDAALRIKTAEPPSALKPASGGSDAQPKPAATAATSASRNGVA